MQEIQYNARETNESSYAIMYWDECEAWGPVCGIVCYFRRYLLHLYLVNFRRDLLHLYLVNFRRYLLHLYLVNFRKHLLHFLVNFRRYCCIFIVNFRRHLLRNSETWPEKRYLAYLAHSQIKSKLCY